MRLLEHTALLGIILALAAWILILSQAKCSEEVRYEVIRPSIITPI
jgi:hypothetical protein